MKRVLTTAISLTVLLLLSGIVMAQNPLGRIVGTIVDQTGAVVSGATVTITNEATGQQQSLASTGEGA